MISFLCKQDFVHSIHSNYKMLEFDLLSTYEEEVLRNFQYLYNNCFEGLLKYDIIPFVETLIATALCLTELIYKRDKRFVFSDYNHDD